MPLHIGKRPYATESHKISVWVRRSAAALNSGFATAVRTVMGNGKEEVIAWGNRKNITP